jgi:hypothetical protein
VAVVRADVPVRPNESGDGYASADEWASIDVIYELALREQDAQIAAWEEADGRLRLLLGFIGVIFAGALGVLGNLKPEAWLARPFAGLAICALVLTGLLVFQAYRPRRLHRPPNIQELRINYLTRSPAETKREIIDQLLQVYNLNQDVIAEKLRIYDRAQSLFFGSIVLLAIAILIRLVGER